MFIRYFAALCSIALFAVAINAQVTVEDDHVNDELDVNQRANLFTRIVAKILAYLFTTAATNCLWEAADNCKSHWKNPGRVISCGTNFLETNKGRCAIGR